MSITRINQELGVSNFNKAVLKKPFTITKARDLLKSKQNKLTELNSTIAKQRHIIIKAKASLETVEKLFPSWDEKKDFNSPYQVTNREVGIAKRNYSISMKEKRSLKKDIEILLSMLEPYGSTNA